MPCFTGTTIASIIDDSCLRLDSCSTLCCLSSREVHTLWILIGLQHPSEKQFHLAISHNHYWKTPLVGLLVQSTSLVYPENILGGQQHFLCSRFYVPLYNGSTCIPKSPIQCGGQWFFWVIHDQRIWGGFLPKFFFAVPLENKLCYQINHWPRHYFSILEVYVFLWYWGSIVENSLILCQFHSYFKHHRYASIFTFCHP